MQSIYIDQLLRLALDRAKSDYGQVSTMAPRLGEDDTSDRKVHTPGFQEVYSHPTYRPV